MITQIRIETSDEERAKLAEFWYGRKKMASRAEILEQVHKFIGDILTGKNTPEEITPADDAPKAEAKPKLPARAIDNFQPSRGDEPYIFKPKDEKMRQLHSNLLDAIQAVEDYTWELMEKNRA